MSGMTVMLAQFTRAPLAAQARRQQSWRCLLQALALSASDVNESA